MENTNVTKTASTNPLYWFMLSNIFTAMALDMEKQGIESFDEFGLRIVHPFNAEIQHEYFKEAHRCMQKGLKLKKQETK